MNKIPLFYFFIIGLFSLAAQTILFREFLTIFHGNELSIGIFYASWFFWISIGATLLIYSEKFKKFFVKKIHILLPFYALAPLIQLFLMRYLRIFTGIPSYEILSPGVILILAFLFNAPLSFLTGTLFSAGVSYIKEQGERAVTKGYIFESIGSFLGGCIVTTLLFTEVNSVYIIYLSSIVLLITGVLFSVFFKSKKGIYFSAIFLLFFTFLLITPFGKYVEKNLKEVRFRVILPQAEFIEEIETPYQIASAGRMKNQIVYISNGEIILTLPSGPSEKANTALFISESKEIENILLFGISSISFLKDFLHYPVKKIEIVEQDKVLVDFIKKFLPFEDKKAIEDKRVNIIINDPRIFIKKTDEKYSLIVLYTSDPTTLLSNRLYTEDFYKDCSKVLSENGVFITKVTSAENYIGTEIQNYGRSILSTLKRVFRQVLITPGEESFFISSKKQGIVTLSHNELKERYDKIALNKKPFPSDGFKTLIPPERIEFVKKIYEVKGEEEELLNTDRHPISFFLGLIVLFRHSESQFVKLFKGFKKIGFYIVIIPIIIFLILKIHQTIFFSEKNERVKSAATIVMAFAGGAAISIQILLMVVFQSRFGALFIEVGLINAIFMAGLFIGGRVGKGLVEKFQKQFLFTIFLIAVFAVFSFSLPFLIHTFAKIYYFFLFLLSGILAGMLWPLTGKIVRGVNEESIEIASSLEASDHWGATLGAFLFGLLFLPLFGERGSTNILVLLFLSILGIFILLNKSNIFFKIKWINTTRQFLKRPSFPFIKTFYLLFGISLTFIFWSKFLKKEVEKPKIFFKEEELHKFTKGDKFLLKETPFIHYITEENEKIKKIIVSSMAVAPAIRGFAGPINLLLIIDGGGILEKVIYIESKETPSYIKGIEKWLLQFGGKDIREEFSFGEGENYFDAMSGATVTSEAALQIINETKAEVGGKILGIDVSKAKGKKLLSLLLDKRTIYIFLAIAGGVIIHLFGGYGVRILFLIFNLVIGGIIFNLGFSITQIMGLLNLELPSISNFTMLFLTTGILGLSLIFGPIYCSHLCPFGALEEILSLFRLRLYPSRDFERILRSLKYIILFALTILLFSPEAENIFAWDPLQHAFKFDLTLSIGMLLFGILLFSLFFFRFYCRYLCPVGAFLNLFNKIASRLKLFPVRNYTNCSLGIQHKYDFDCIQCNRCVRKKDEKKFK